MNVSSRCFYRNMKFKVIHTIFSLWRKSTKPPKNIGRRNRSNKECVQVSPSNTYNTVLIDFDCQGHSSIIFGVKNNNKLEVTINTLLRRLIEDQPQPTPESY